MTEYQYTDTIEAIDAKFEGRDFLLVDDVANYLEITPRHVVRLINRGDIPAFRIGRPWRIPREGFKVFLGSASVHTDGDKSK